MRRFGRGVLQCHREAWDGLWRNPGLSLLSALAIGISLYVAGAFLILAFNLHLFVGALGQETQVQIYLADDAGPEAIGRLRAELATDPAVASIREVGRDEARRRFERAFPALRDVATNLENNPFPASLELEIEPGHRNAEAVRLLAKSYRAAPGVQDIRYDLGWVERLAGIAALVRRGGFGIGALLAAAALVTVGAVVRLTVLARREEIEIMKLVGATAAFIRTPFLLGAAAQGLLGGAFAAAALAATHTVVVRSTFYGSNPFLSLLAGQLPPAAALAGLAAFGALLGLAAAALSLRRAGTF